ncbi:hypothetical protein EC991_003291 [Linnemannia zychae]|nr:hypothetical protein EC991_003291 [Linnemannia zychae]
MLDPDIHPTEVHPSTLSYCRSLFDWNRWNHSQKHKHKHTLELEAKMEELLTENDSLRGGKDTITLNIIVRPDRAESFPLMTDTKATTISKLGKSIYTVYTVKEDGEAALAVIHPRGTFEGTECSSDDDHFGDIIQLYRRTNVKMLTVALETPIMLKEVNSLYEISNMEAPTMSDLPPSTGISTEPLDAREHKKSLWRLLDELESRIRAVPSDTFASEATYSAYVCSFLTQAVLLFSEVKHEDYRKELAQNLVMLESIKVHALDEHDGFDINAWISDGILQQCVALERVSAMELPLLIADSNRISSMDPLSKVPVECLQLILQVLAHNNCAGSLAALLQTNRYISSIALPFLYSNPYRKHFHGIISVEAKTPLRSDEVLSRMLLSQLSPDTSAVITHALRSEPSKTRPEFTSKSPLEYFAHIRHLCLPTGAVDLDFFWPQGRWHPDTDDFMNGQKFAQMRKAHNLLPAYDDNMGSELEIQLYHFQVILWREALWTLASPIFEQLQSMTISVFDIDRYFGIQGRLKNLEHIHFALDDVVDYGEEAYYGDEMDMSDEFRAAAKARKERNFKSMIQFVRDHVQLFPGSLKTVTSYDSGLWRDLYQTCSVEVELEILRLLPPLQAPTSLNKDNFLHLSAHPQSTDLSHVQEITDLESPSLWFHLPRDGREFLQRCRALKSIHMETLGQGSFTWAAQEKRDKESLGNINNNTAHGDTGVSALEPSRPDYLTYGLIPLEEFNILEADYEPLSDEVDDIVFAFSQTLKKLTVTAATYQQMRIPRTLRFGRGWVDLPVLTTLYISAAWNKLALDISLYRHCPNLKYASLTDHSTRYQCQDIVTCLYANLPRLDKLDLIGWSALSFNPDILQSTVALKNVCISIGSDDVDGYFIPPKEELDRSFRIAPDSVDGVQSGATLGLGRPQWTWDWYLPQLTSLKLTAEFAFRFQFRMLQGCPALESLSLNMRASFNTTPQLRILEMSELFMPRAAAGTLNEAEAIIAPALTALRLIGHWVVGDSLLQQFFICMFPMLEDLEEEGMYGYTLEKLVDVVRTMPNKLEEMHLSLLEPCEELAEKLGLVCENDSEDEDEDDGEDEDEDGSEALERGDTEGEEKEKGRGGSNVVSIYLGWSQYTLTKNLVQSLH